MQVKNPYTPTQENMY